MNKGYVTLTSVSMLGLVATAHAGTPVQLNDWQMDVVTAGSAAALAAFQTTVSGHHTASQTNVSNIAVDRRLSSLAQSRTAVLVSGTGKASVATNVVNQSVADGHGPAQFATASTAGSASGATATVGSLGITTAISASAGPGHSMVGIAESLAHVTAFSASGRSR